MTRAASRLAHDLADAISSGAQVDWEELRRRQARLGSPPLLANLQRLSRVLRVEPADAQPGRSGESLFARGVAALAVLQVLGALLGGAIGRPDPNRVYAVFPYLATLAFLVGGLWLFLGGRGDARARHLGVFFLLNATATGQSFLTRLLVDLPVGALRPWLSNLYLEALLPLFLWLFVRDFPRTLRVGRDGPLVQAGIALSSLLGSALLLLNLALALELPAVSGVFELQALGRRHPAGGYWTVLLVLMLLALPLPFYRARRAPQREAARVRLFGWALLLGLLPLIADILAGYLSPAWDAFQGQPDTGVVTTPIVYAFLLTLPLTTAYSVMRHGTLDVRDLLRSAARLALARWTLALATLATLTASVALISRHQERSLRELAQSGESLLLGALLLTSILLLAGREAALGAIDRILTGRPRSWRRQATAALDRLRYARSFGELEGCLGEAMQAALPGGALALLVREEGSELFAPLQPGRRGLQASTAVVAMLTADRTPIRVQAEHDASWFAWLPEGERVWVVEQRVALIAPLSLRSGTPIALAVVVEPHTPLAFGAESIDFLGETCATAGLSAENLLAAAGASVGHALRDEPWLECMTCGRLAEPALETCGCGGGLIRALLPPVLNAKFRLLRVLGTGGMGRVYEAEELALSRRVALKAMPRTSAAATVTLRQEARAMAAVSHPNLASIHGLESWRGAPILVVEYLAGGTLADRTGTPWQEPAALDVAQSVCAGLVALHEAGIAHRDIKPSNIAFTADGVAKLLDFGLSRGAGAAWREDPAEGDAPPPLASTPAGTPFYLPPEVLRGEEAEPVAQDLWALVLVLFEMLAGGLRLGGRNPLEVLASGALPDPRQQIEGCREPLAAFLVRGLHREPSQRPATARALLAQLTALVSATGALRPDAALSRPPAPAASASPTEEPPR